MVISSRDRLTLTLPLLVVAWVSCHGADDIVATRITTPSDGGNLATGGTDPHPSLGGGGGSTIPDELPPLTGDLEVHDPTLAVSAGSFFLFHTGPLLPLKVSSDLSEWKAAGSAFKQAPEWIAQLLPDATDLWAPDLSEFGGVFHLYYAASTFGTGRSCIGHAVADVLAVDTEWQDRGTVICSDIDEEVDWDAIDPSVFRDENGGHHMVFGSYSSGIKMIHLNAEGDRADESLISLAARPTEVAIQAPAAFYRAPYYYLLSTFDRCCAGVDSTSNIRVGRSESVEGPYIDRDGSALLEGGGSLLVEGTSRFPGVGAGTVLTVEGDHWLAYHAYDANAAGRATLRISKLDWNEGDWPSTPGP